MGKEDSEQIVVVATVPQNTATIVKAILGEKDIPCTLYDENASNVLMDIVIGSMLGGIRIAVFEKDAEAVRQIVDEVEKELRV